MENKKKYSSKKLWHILLDLDMTTQELARRSGVSVSSLARLKNGIPLSYNKMRKICDVVGCENVDDIYRRSTWYVVYKDITEIFE